MTIKDSGGHRRTGTSECQFKKLDFYKPKFKLHNKEILLIRN